MTKIEWTDATWNPVTGCTHVSAGCKNCYAETFAHRGMGPWKGRDFGDVRCHPERLDWPLRKRKPLRIFVNSMSDLFHEKVPDEFIDRVFKIMQTARHHVFQILTKRPERMRDFLGSRVSVPWGGYVFPEPWGKHIWLGVSVSHEPDLWMVEKLLQTPAAVRFVSYEPALGPVDFKYEHLHKQLCQICREDDGSNCYCDTLPQPLDWLIVGGESGPGARPCDVGWIRSVVRQGKAAGVPVFVKQMGANITDRNDAGFEGWEPNEWPLGTETDEFWNDPMRRHQGAPCRVILRDRKGGDPSEWPEELRVRDFPK